MVHCFNVKYIKSDNDCIITPVEIANKSFHLSFINVLTRCFSLFTVSKLSLHILTFGTALVNNI